MVVKLSDEERKKYDESGSLKAHIHPDFLWYISLEVMGDGHGARRCWERECVTERARARERKCLCSENKYE
jgi:hypothetical protein